MSRTAVLTAQHLEHGPEQGAVSDPWAGIPAEAWTADGRLDLNRVPNHLRFNFLLGQHTYAFQGGAGDATYEPAIDGQGVRGSIHGSVSGQRFAGASLTFTGAEGVWARRWIDTLGNVLIGRVEFVPDWEESGLGALVSHLNEVDGVLFRHVWYDITRESFGTDLLASRDGGASWVLARRMPYVRSH